MIICGTGHRPNKLGGYTQDAWDRVYEIADAYLEQNTSDIDYVISGGALGWDQVLAHAARANNIPYVMALPFPGFEDRWPQRSKDTLYGLMHGAREVVFVCSEGYAGWKMQKRNEWMVDKADTVLALWDGSSGGTGNCIAYANKVKKPIINLWDEYSK
jgi:uncharacterized phage-like protein YoqJ